MAWRCAVAIALLLFSSLPALAQDNANPHRNPTPDGGITAFVTSVSGNTITLVNGAITIDATDAIIANRAGLASLDAVQPGAQIVASIPNPGAPPRPVLPASHILILEAPAASLNGPVQSIDVKGPALTIFGTRVGHSDAAGRITAARIAASNPRPHQPIAQTPLQGVVKSIAPDSWVITARDGNDVTVIVNDETNINPTIKLGDAVRIALRADSPDRPIAVAVGKEVKAAAP